MFGGRMVKWPFRGNRPAIAELALADNPSAGNRRLMMLVSDASGLASFQLSVFSDSPPAVDFIRRSFGDRTDTGLIAFWATSDRPDVQPQLGANTDIEAIVMVRHEAGSEVVYPFSFVDIGTALSFVRYEMGRGLDPHLVMVYWAVPVQLVIPSSGEVTLSPEMPPATFVEPFELPEPVESGRVQAKKPRSIVLEPAFVSTADDPIEAMFRKSEEKMSAIEEMAGTAGGGGETHETEGALFAEQSVGEAPGDLGKPETTDVTEEAAAVASLAPGDRHDRRRGAGGGRAVPPPARGAPVGGANRSFHRIRLTTGPILEHRQRFPLFRARRAKARLVPLLDGCGGLCYHRRAIDGGYRTPPLFISDTYGNRRKKGQIAYLRSQR